MIDVLEKITQLRKQRGWTIYRLAEESELSQSALSNMFSRKNLPNLTSLNLICNAFGITLSEFFSETPENNENEILSIYRRLKASDKKTLTAFAKFLETGKNV